MTLAAAVGATRMGDDSAQWMRDILMDVHVRELERIGAEDLWHGMRIMTGAGRSCRRLSVRYPATRTDGTGGPTTIRHQIGDDAATRTIADHRTLVEIRRMAFERLMAEETDPEGVLDEDVAFPEMECPGMLTRLFEHHRVDPNAVGEVTGDDRTWVYGWEIGSPDVVCDQPLKNLPKGMPGFLFTTDRARVASLTIDLAPGVRMKDDRIVIEGNRLPETIMAGIVGMPVHDVIRHHVLDHPALIVRRARHVRSGTELVLDGRGDRNIVAGYHRYLKGGAMTPAPTSDPHADIRETER